MTDETAFLGSSLLWRIAKFTSQKRKAQSRNCLSLKIPTENKTPNNSPPGGSWSQNAPLWKEYNKLGENGPGGAAGQEDS